MSLEKHHKIKIVGVASLQWAGQTESLVEITCVSAFYLVVS